VAGAAKDLEGFKSFERLKPGNGRLECLNSRGL
jgi:heme-degrading monooxygenase HmoA